MGGRGRGNATRKLPHIYDLFRGGVCGGIMTSALLFRARCSLLELRGLPRPLELTQSYTYIIITDSIIHSTHCLTPTDSLTDSVNDSLAVSSSYCSFTPSVDSSLIITGSHSLSN